MAGTRRTVAALAAAVTITLALITVEGTTSTAAAAVDPDCGTSPSAVYTNCVFHDSFSGGEDGITLNDANWTKFNDHRLPSGVCLKEGYATVGGGTLNLKSEVLATAIKCTPLSLVKTRFVGASVTTDAKFAHTYGRIEFRAALPSSNTLNHTALWMNPTKLTYGRHPRSGEIDVMERFAPPVNLDPNTVHQTIHYEEGPNLDDKEFGTCTVSTPTEFHLYGVEWSESRMKFYIDNQLCNDFDWAPTNVDPPKPFDKPFNLITTQISGGDASTPAGNERITKIDWVKFWGE